MKILGKEEKPSNSASISQIAKSYKAQNCTSISVMKINANILKILTNLIQHDFNKLMFHNQVGTIPESKNGLKLGNL